MLTLIRSLVTSKRRNNDCGVDWGCWVTDHCASTCSADVITCRLQVVCENCAVGETISVDFEIVSNVTATGVASYDVSEDVTVAAGGVNISLDVNDFNIAGEEEYFIAYRGEQRLHQW